MATAVDVEVADGVAWVTLDGPDTRNALDAAAAADLVAACERVEHDPAVGAAVITGSGGAFCSGADTHALDALRTAPAGRIYEGLEDLYRAFRRVGQLAVPTVAAIDGPAVGAGVNLALACDLRIVTDRARLISGFARIGLHPGGGHLHLLARAGNAGTAAAAGLFAQPVDAGQAVSSGLAWALVSTADLRAQLTRMTAHLAADPVLARALAATFRRTIMDTAAWDRAVEIERARQMWSLTRSTPSKES
jgi:Enoyl-CoA hydratase/carnithine racemase